MGGWIKGLAMAALFREMCLSLLLRICIAIMWLMVRVPPGICRLTSFNCVKLYMDPHHSHMFWIASHGKLVMLLLAVFSPECWLIRPIFGDRGRGEGGHYITEEYKTVYWSENEPVRSFSRVFDFHEETTIPFDTEMYPMHAWPPWFYLRCTEF